MLQTLRPIKKWEISNKMLTNLYIKNYALIEELNLELKGGFISITGETGAGKSILLGALGLVLGKRADLKSLGKKEAQCIIEAKFDVSNLNLQSIFEKEDLDYEQICILRRQISPSGKSRAFINDIPVSLSQLSKVAQHLIDIHSQNDNLLLNNSNFQLSLIDNFAKNRIILNAYKAAYKDYKSIENELKELNKSISSEIGDLDYLQFLFEELESARLISNEQEELENELEIAQNASLIAESIDSSLAILNKDENGALESLNRIKQSLNKIQNFGSVFNSLSERILNLTIELDDIRLELEKESQNLSVEPNRLEEIDSRLSSLINLQRKHKVNSVEELIIKRDELDSILLKINSFDDLKAKIEGRLLESKSVLAEKSIALSKNRKSQSQKLEIEIKKLLVQLNLKDAELKIAVEDQKDFTASGKDQISFKFSANKGQEAQDVSKVASGGELSRIMLALKAILAKTKNLPSIIFDEIDTGVSGETAEKIGNILKEMSRDLQLICITHLPQIASKASTNLMVVKSSDTEKTVSNIIELSKEDSVNEIARLLSGELISEAALNNAKELINRG